ncbi:hypothetical protein ACYZT4_19430 [Pseudomonas sp. GB2N2]
MTAKLKLRRENPNLVPCRNAYLLARSSAFCQKISDFPVLLNISSVLPKTA